MDLLLAQSQRLSYERVASLKGQTLSQWSTRKLDEAGRRDIEEAGVTRMHADALEPFCGMLEDPLSQAAREPLSREEIWV